MRSAIATHGPAVIETLLLLREGRRGQHIEIAGGAALLAKAIDRQEDLAAAASAGR